MSKVFFPRSHHPLDASTKFRGALSQEPLSGRPFGAVQRACCDRVRPGSGSRLCHHRLWSPALLLAALGIGLPFGTLGCGGDDERPAARTGTPAEVTTTDDGGGAAVPRATTPSTSATQAPGASDGGENQPGGAGDEAGGPTYRVAISADAVSPRRVEVPAYLGVTVRVRSADGRAHAVRVAGRNWSVPAGGEVAIALDGLRPGHALVAEVDGGRLRFTVASGAGPLR